MRPCIPLTLTALILALPACRSASPDAESEWRNRERRQLKQRAQRLIEDGDAELSLHVCSVAHLDRQTFLLGGSYHNGAGSCRSALLRTTDRGKTWRDTGVWLDGSSTIDLFVLDDRHAWALVCWAIEGHLTPFTVFRTTDAGATWQRAEQDLPLDHIGIPMSWGLRFASPDRGQFWITGSIGPRLHYVTDDGGATWRLAHRVPNAGRLDAEPHAEFVQDIQDRRVRIRAFDPNHGRFEQISSLPTAATLDANGHVHRRD